MAYIRVSPVWYPRHNFCQFLSCNALTPIFTWFENSITPPLSWQPCRFPSLPYLVRSCLTGPVQGETCGLFSLNFLWMSLHTSDNEPIGKLAFSILASTILSVPVPVYSHKKQKKEKKWIFNSPDPVDNLQHNPSSLKSPMTSYLPVSCKGNPIHSVAPAVVPTPIPTLHFGIFTSNGCVPEWFGTGNPDLIKNLAKNLAGTLAELNYTFFTSISVDICTGRYLNHLLPTLGHPRRSLQHINLRGSIVCIQSYKKSSGRSPVI